MPVVIKIPYEDNVWKISDIRLECFMLSIYMQCDSKLRGQNLRVGRKIKNKAKNHCIRM